MRRFDFTVAGKMGLVFGRDRVDVRRIERVGADAVARGLGFQFIDEISRPVRSLGKQDAAEGVEPFLGFQNIVVAVFVPVTVRFHRVLRRG